MERLNRLFRLSLLLLFLPTASQARLGENSTEIADRYGPPKEYRESPGILPPFLKGAYVRQYEKGGWIIVAAFLDVGAPAIRLRYQKKGFTTLTGEEIKTVLQANCFGMTWRPDLPSNVGEAAMSPFFRFRRWIRDDGATAFLQDRTLQLDSPEVAKHEARIKKKRIRKARETRPDF